MKRRTIMRKINERAEKESKVILYKERAKNKGIKE